MVEVKEFDTREHLIGALTEFVIKSLEAGIAGRGAASMLLSGGSTPGPLYENMSNTDLDWQNVWFAPTDERWVEPDHPDSNERLIRRTLLKNKAGEANYIGLKSAGKSPEEGQAETENKLMALPQPLDIVLLGMGEDGHFASLFPNLRDTEKAMDLNCPTLSHLIDRGGGELGRMTMTLGGIMNASHIVILFFGDKKLEVFEQAGRGADQNLPISFLLQQQDVPVSLYWSE